MIDTQKHIRKPLYVDAVRITTANFDEIAAWCQGEVLEENSKRYIKVRVHNPKNPRQTKAFVGDWLLYTERGYKVYTNKAFHASFDLVNDPSVVTPPTQIEAVATQVVPQSEMAQAIATIEAEGDTVEEATPEGIVDTVQQNERARKAEGKTIISEEEQASLTQDEIREMLQSGEYVLAQDLAA